jgi:hypothetical protein
MRPASGRQHIVSGLGWALASKVANRVQYHAQLGKYDVTAARDERSNLRQLEHHERDTG